MAAKTGIFRKRDLAVLVLVAISLYLSYFDSPTLNFSIEPAWFIDQKASTSSLLKDVNYKMVPPIVTDLEGDGVNEIVMITHDLKLKVHYCTNLSPVRAGSASRIGLMSYIFVFSTL